MQVCGVSTCYDGALKYRRGIFMGLSRRYMCVMVLPWCFHDAFMGSRCFHGAFVVFLWRFMDFHDVFTLLSWCSHGVSWAFMAFQDASVVLG